jgi:thiosulfate dehydrogenase
MPWVGVYGRFPQYRSRSGRVARIEERINDCIERSLNGTALPTGGDDMRDIVSYLSWLSRGTASGARLRGTGIDSLVPIAADTGRGRAVYAQQCARCHAPDGGGLRGRGVQHPGPPLWGDGSFNIGSGMARVRVMAAFVRRQMPFDAPGSLTAQEAFDVAAFLGARPRPDYPPKQFDWPNGDPPPDVAYPTVAAGKRSARP